jgi:hypothetical protein
MTTCETAEESETKKCTQKIGEARCGKPAVGVICTYLGHSYVCREHAKKSEADGLWVDYDNWRL